MSPATTVRSGPNHDRSTKQNAAFRGTETALDVDEVHAHPAVVADHQGAGVGRCVGVVASHAAQTDYRLEIEAGPPLDAQTV